MRILRIRLVKSNLELRTFKSVAATLLLLALSQSLLLFPSTYAADNGSKNLTKVSGWRIEQRSNDGLLTMLLCDQGVRMSWRNKDLISVCKGPAFIPTLYNLKRKTQYIGIPEKWSRQSPHLPNEITEFGTKEIVAEKWRGQPASRVTYKVTASDALKERLEFAYQESSNRSTSFNKIEVVYCEWIKLVPKLKNYLAPYYRLPDMQRLPLQCLHRYPNGNTDYFLETTKIESVMISPSEFSVPSGLETTKLRDMVMENRDQRKQIPGVVEDLFGGKN